MVKIRVCSFLFFGAVLFIFLTTIPTGFWRSPSIPSSEPKTLQVEDSAPSCPSDVIAVCIPMTPLEDPDAGETQTMAGTNDADQTVSLATGQIADQSVGQSASQPTGQPIGQPTGQPADSAPNSVPDSSETVAIVPNAPQNSDASESPTTGQNNENRTESTEVPGAYPESEFLKNHSGPASVPKNPASENAATPENSAESKAPGSSDVSESRTTRAELSQQDELFSETFLNESPMVSKGNPPSSSNSLFLKVSRVCGLDVIPEEAGVNGRSIYGTREHTIEDGDSLPALAARYLGDPDREEEIFEKNRHILSSKEELPIGTILQIPER